MNAKPNKRMATYFGLKVEVVSRVDIYTLIRFQAHEFIVETADIVIVQSAEWAA